MWITSIDDRDYRTNTFKKGFRTLSSGHKRRVQAVIDLISKVENPRILGIRKKGKLAYLYSHEVGQQIRILFSVSGETVALLPVGSHARVYK